MDSVVTDRDGTTQIALHHVSREDTRIIDDLGQYQECFTDRFSSAGRRGHYTMQTDKPVDPTSSFFIRSFAAVADAVYLSALGKPKSSADLHQIERQRFDESFRLRPLANEAPNGCIKLPCRIGPERFLDYSNYIDLVAAFESARNAIAVLKQEAVGLLPDRGALRSTMYRTANRNDIP